MCGGMCKKFPSEFQQDFLDAHNDYRSRHGAPALKLNSRMCNYAEDRAKLLCACNVLKRNKNCPYGENVYFKSTSKKVYPDPYEVVEKWYSEIRKSDMENNFYPTKDTKRLTQIIWKSTEALGVGYAVNEAANKIYVVAIYYPASDFETFAENVQPPQKKRKEVYDKVKIL